jgi:hypothetical protein
MYPLPPQPQNNQAHTTPRDRRLAILPALLAQCKRQQLSLVDWDSLLVSDDIEISTSNITRALIDAANTNIPNRVITVRKDNPPWVITLISGNTESFPMTW